MRLSIHDFTIKDFDRLVELFSKEFGPVNRLLNVNYNRWLYMENPNGIAKIITAAQDGAWIGFMAMIPVVLTRQGAKETAYYVVNVLVDPAYRGRQIFSGMISVAADYCKSEDALLMGYPNSAALGTWRRAGMQFCRPLRAHFLRPRLPGFGPFVWRNVHDTSNFERFAACYNEDSKTTSRMRVLLSKDYLQWRYLEHPTTNYRLQLISSETQLLGLIATKHLCAGVHMLTDSFFLPELSGRGFSWAPWLTVALVREEPTDNLSRVLRKLIRKEIPFFCNDYRAALEESDVLELGLSISDF